MLNERELKVLSCFFPNLEQRTSKQIEEHSKYSHERVFMTLKKLVKERYLEERKVGKTNIYDFVFTDESYLIFAYYMTSRIEQFKKRHSLLYKRLLEFVGSIKANSVILFGSYAKGTETEESDVDLLCVSNGKGIERVANTFKTKYDMSIRPVVVKPSDFKNIKKDNETFYKDMVEFGVVISGIEFFFNEVYR